jgi:hypothetical protein
MEQCLIAPDNWSLRGFVLKLVESGGQTLSPYPRLSLMMHRLGTPFDINDPARKVMEVARVAFADERSILSDEIESLLLLKFTDPLAGIIGGHLLLIEHERDPRRDIGSLDAVVNNLRALVGDEHPDVECLSLRCPDESLRRTRALRAPPLYQRSWKLLIEASQQNGSLVPKKMWDRVQANGSLPPYLIWAPDADSKTASLRATVNALVRVVNPALAAAFPTAVSAVRAAMELREIGDRIGASPAPADLSKTLLAVAKQHAEQLQLPPSALKALGEDLRSRFRG